MKWWRMVKDTTFLELSVTNSHEERNQWRVQWIWVAEIDTKSFFDWYRYKNLQADLFYICMQRWIIIYTYIYFFMLPTDRA